MPPKKKIELSGSDSDTPERVASSLRYKNIKTPKRGEEDYNKQGVSDKFSIDTSFEDSAEIDLDEEQEEWFQKVQKILGENRMYIDTSEMGSGKTFIVMALAQELKLKLFVICPAGVEHTVWREYSKKYKIPVETVIGYELLRSMTGHQPKHGYLEREDFVRIEQVENKKTGEIKEFERDDVVFKPTKKFKDAVKKGILLIFDEFQMIKNNTAQFKASLALIRTADSITSNSRIGLLSATPMDKPDHVANLFYIMGFFKSIYPYDEKKEFKEKLDDIDEELSNSLVVYGFNDEDNFGKYLIEVYKRFFRNTISGFIKRLNNFYTVKGDEIMKQIKKTKDPIKLEELYSQLEPETLSNDIRYGYYVMSKPWHDRLAEDVDKFNNLGVFVGKRRGFITGTKGLGEMQKLLSAIEMDKLEIFYRLTLDILQNTKYDKIIICLNFLNTISALKDLLKKYHPLVLIGSIQKKNRTPIIDSFNNDLKRRILICNTKVGGVGISLHDRVGNAPRHMFISPNFSMLPIHQATGRHFRRGVRSNATTRIVFGDGIVEKRLLKVLVEKSTNLRKVITNKNTILPDVYETEIEVVKSRNEIKEFPELKKYLGTDGGESDQDIEDEPEDESEYESELDPNREPDSDQEDDDDIELPVLKK